MWIRGPLRKPGEDDKRQAEIDEKAEKVTELYNKVLVMHQEQLKAKAQARARGEDQENPT